MGLVAAPLSCDGSALSTLRARLSSLGPPSPLGADLSDDLSKDPLELSDLHQQFLDCFVPKKTVVASTCSDTKNGSCSNENEDLMAILGESIAEASFNIYTSVVDQLRKAQVDVHSKISDFSETSLSILSDLDNLYSNLACPLSATICHSPSFPRGTLGAHFASMRENLKLADGELCKLRADWDETMRLEDDLRQELLQESEGQCHATVQPLDVGQVEAFKQEGERIVCDQLKALDDIEAHYKELVQLKTMEMMHFILGD